MKKDLINAALFGAFRIGATYGPWSLGDTLGMNYAQLLEAYTPHVTTLTEMVELAEGMAMAKPDDVNGSVYYEFADDWCRMIRSESRLYTPQEAHAQMVHVVGNAFGPLMSQTARELLHKKLMDMGPEDE